MPTELREVEIKKEDIRRLVACSYVDNYLVMSRNPEVLQLGFDILIRRFGYVGLRTNTKKTDIMAFIPGHIHMCLLTDT